MRREHAAGGVKIQRIAPYGVGAGFDCEACLDGYLGRPGGYDAPRWNLSKRRFLRNWSGWTPDRGNSPKF